MNVIFSCGTGDIFDLSSLDLRNVNLDYYDFTDKHMANTILNPFKLDSTNFTNANMFGLILLVQHKTPQSPGIIY